MENAKLIGKVSKEVWQKMLQIAHELDLNKGGLYDARLAAINIWVSPKDKPGDWKFPITKGALNYPREYLATIYGKRIGDDVIELYLSVKNYVRRDYAERCLEEFDWVEYKRQRDLSEKGTSEEWKWAMEKAKWLIEQAKRESVFKDIMYCPFCGEEFKEIKVFNEFISHLTTHVEVKSVILTDEGYFIETSKGVLTPHDYIKTVREVG